jgi:CubicO group peptidase (beta-lactamase class C family)
MYTLLALPLMIASMSISEARVPETSQQAFHKAAVRIDSLLSARYAADGPGAAILVACGDSVIIDKGYGLADLSAKSKIDGNTMFNIASISKQFTSVGILKLQEMGKVDINESVSKYFPYFSNKQWRKIRLRHLMSHTSGVPDTRTGSRDFVLYANDEQSISYMAALDSFKFKPGAYYDYINPTFDLLGIIIGKASGLGFDEFQRRYVFEPSGMKAVTYFSPDIAIENMSHGYVREKDGEWKERDYGEESFFATKADGGIYTTTRELLNWENALRDCKCISASSRDEAYAKHIKVSGSKWCDYQNRPHTWYGYGWFIDETPGMPLKIYHTGDNGGFQAYLAKYPSLDVKVIILENRNDIDRWAMQKEIENILAEEGILHR